MKVTGKEWQAFLDSWPEGWWYDDSDELVDGKEWNGDRLQGSEAVSVTTGVLFKGHGSNAESADLLAQFRKWRKAQTHVSVLVEIPREALDQLNADVARIGGKVLP